MVGSKQKGIWEKTLQWSLEAQGELVVQAGPDIKSYASVLNLAKDHQAHTSTVLLLIATRENTYHGELWHFSVRGCLDLL